MKRGRPARWDLEAAVERCLAFDAETGRLPTAFDLDTTAARRNGGPRLRLLERLAPMPNARVARRLCGSWEAFAEQVENAWIAEIVLSDIPGTSEWDAQDRWSLWRLYTALCEQWEAPYCSIEFDFVTWVERWPRYTARCETCGALGCSTHFDALGQTTRAGGPFNRRMRHAWCPSRVESLLIAAVVLPDEPISRVVDAIAFAVEHFYDDDAADGCPVPHVVCDEDAREVIEAAVRRVRALGFEAVPASTLLIHQTVYPEPSTEPVALAAGFVTTASRDLPF